jgi:hypothetical protein
MFGLRLTTKRELELLAATVRDLQRDIDYLRRQVEIERSRADAAVNALLVKKQGVALRPEIARANERQQEEEERALDLFGEFDDESTKEILNALQGAE